jgi:hypothetical protein
MPTYPAALKTGTVTLTVYDLIGDRTGGGQDVDDLPDVTDVTLSVSFRPSVDALRPGGTGPVYRMLGDYSWSGTSVLTAPDGTGSYVLPSTDNPTHRSGVGWTWEAEVTVVANGVQSSWASEPFTLTDAAVVDLAPLLELGVRGSSLGATIVTTGSTLPDQTGQSGKVLTTDGNTASWQPGSGSVTSVAGRTGVVTISSTDVTDSTVTGRSVLTAASATAARTAIGAGTSSLVLGTTTGTAAAGNDSRLSDARTPLTHTHTRADVSDATADGRTIMAAPALPALDVWQASNGTWPARPTWSGRVNWIGYPALTSLPTGAAADDTYMARP